MKFICSVLIIILVAHVTMAQTCPSKECEHPGGNDDECKACYNSLPFSTDYEISLDASTGFKNICAIKSKLSCCLFDSSF